MSGIGFRPEVQALRAVAVMMVVVFHLQPAALPGGFIGVDVFFVISGFLITGHLLREHARTSRVDLAAFWAARARRILPAALVCIAVTMVAVWALLPPTQWARLGTHGIASTLSALNWVLAADAVDYLAASNDVSPLQHFWSLGVEEQFYLFWPFVVVAAGAGVARWRGRAMPTMLFAGVAVASFALSAVAVMAGDPAAYFATTTRVWELAVGGLLALWLPTASPRPLVGVVCSLTGLLVIGAAGLAISRDDPFPGALALVPVVGAALVIAGGTPHGALSPAPLIRWRPVQWLGGISYSLYLWHFPPIVLFSAVAGRAPGWFASSAIVVGSIVLAALSHRFIERPIRGAAWLRVRSWRALSAGAVAMTTTAVVCLALPAAQHQIEQEWLRAAAALDASGATGAEALAERRAASVRAIAYGDGEVAMTPAPSRAGADFPARDHPGCSAAPRSDETPLCVGGDPDGAVRVVLVGDSHAEQFLPALFQIGAERGWRVETRLHASCPFNAERRLLETRGGSVCAGPNATTLTALLGDPPDLVVTANWASGDFEETDTGHAPGVLGYADWWNLLADAGSEVVAIKDTPMPRDDPRASDCLAANYAQPERCGMPRGEAVRLLGIVDKAQVLAPRTSVIDLTDLLCVEDVCPAVIGNVLVYRDTNHLTDTFVRTMTPFLAERLPDPTT